MYGPNSGDPCGHEPGVHQEFDDQAAALVELVSDELADTQRHFSYYWDVGQRQTGLDGWKECIAECILTLRQFGWLVEPPDKESKALPCAAN